MAALNFMDSAFLLLSSNDTLDGATDLSALGTTTGALLKVVTASGVVTPSYAAASTSGAPGDYAPGSLPSASLVGLTGTATSGSLLIVNSAGAITKIADPSTSGQVLKYNGTTFAWGADGGAGFLGTVVVQAVTATNSYSLTTLPSGTTKATAFYGSTTTTLVDALVLPMTVYNISGTNGTLKVYGTVATATSTDKFYVLCYS